MKINSSVILMSGSTSAVEKRITEITQKMWIRDAKAESVGENTVKTLQSDIVEISEDAQNMPRCTSCEAIVKNEGEIALEISDRDKQKMLILQKMIEAITGKKFKFYGIDEIKFKKVKAAFKDVPIKKDVPQGDAQKEYGWGVEIDVSNSYYEKQTLSFSAQGVISTADGREISFAVDLTASREFASQFSLHIRAGDAVLRDPLVLSFDGELPQFSESKFSFDLDCDGNEDLLPYFSTNSGFLSFDRNEDGLINNGKELFGPISGDGFKDLVEYDDDQNNWIDENDPIFDKLRIWTKDENGSDKLFALGVLGIGAIYLGNIETLFELKDSQNNLQGQNRKMGLFVEENGRVGTLHHIDITV